MVRQMRQLPRKIFPALLSLGVVVSLCAAATGFAEHAAPPPTLVRTVRFLTIAETPRPQFVCPALAEEQAPPKIDGHLDDACWDAGARVGYLALMTDGGTPAEITEAWICHDDARLYVAFSCRDRKVSVLRMPRGPDEPAAFLDAVLVLLDVNGDGRTFRAFAVNSFGMRREESNPTPPEDRRSWEAMAFRGDNQWSAEFAIPFAALGVDAPQDAAWRLNLARRALLSGQTAAWSPSPASILAPDRAGHLLFGEATAPEEPPLSLQLDRDQYTTLNRRMRAFVRMDRKAEFPPPTPEGATEAELDAAPKPEPAAPATQGEDKNKRRLELMVVVAGAEEAENGASEKGEKGENWGTKNAGKTEKTQETTKTEVAKEGVETAAVAGSVLQTLAGNAADLTIDLDAVPPGEYQLVATLVSDSGRHLARAAVDFRTPAMPRAVATRMRVPLLMLGRATKHFGWPVSGAVAVPRGLLDDAAHVRLLDAKGREIPVEAAPRAWWSSHGGIRWLGIHFQPPINATRGATYTLECGEDVRPKHIAQSLEVTNVVAEDQESIVVKTGRILFNISVAPFSGIDKIWFDRDGDGIYAGWRELVVQSRTVSDFYMVSGNGTLYTAAADPESMAVLEEVGPLRVVVRAEGRYHKAAESATEPAKPTESTGPRVSREHPEPETIGNYVIRFYAYVNQPFIRVVHTFFVDRNTLDMGLRDLGFRLPMPLLRGKKTAILGLNKPREHTLAKGERISVMQLLPDRCRAQTLGDASRTIAEAQRGDWVALRDSKGGAAILVRDAAERFPLEFEISAKGEMVLHFWPTHSPPQSRILPAPTNSNLGDLWFAHTGNTLDFKIPGRYCESYPRRGQVSDFEAVLSARQASPLGVAITHEFLIYFQSRADSAELARASALLNRWPQPVVAPGRLCGDELLGPVMPRDLKGNAAWEDAIESAWRRVMQREDANPAVGIFNFQALHSRWLPDEKRWALRRRWRANRDGQGMIPWTLFARSGEQQYIHLARRNTRQLMDVIMCHADAAGTLRGHPDGRLRKVKGAFGRPPGILRWQGQHELRSAAADPSFLVAAYIFTGDARAREAAAEWADVACESPGPFDASASMWTIEGLMAVYSIMPKSAYIRTARELADQLLETPVDEWRLTRSAPGLWRYHAYTRDPRVVERLAEFAKLPPSARPLPASLRLTVQAALLGGDAALLKECEAVLAAFAERVGKEADFPSGWDEAAWFLRDLPLYLYARRVLSAK